MSPVPQSLGGSEGKRYFKSLEAICYNQPDCRRSREGSGQESLALKPSTPVTPQMAQRFLGITLGSGCPSLKVL